MDTINLIAKAKSLHLVSSRLLEGLISGNYRTVFRGPGIEFDEVREYVDTDDARNIDWNVSSRLGSPFTKTYKEEREIALFILVDVSASMASGTSEMTKADTANMISALLSLAAVHNNDRVGALFFTDRIEKLVRLGKGMIHASRLVRDMAMLKPAGRGSDLKLACRIAHETLKRRGICIIVSDFRMNTGLRELTLLSKKHDVIAIKVTDPADSKFPATGLIELIDPEERHRLLAVGRSGKFQQEYREFWEMEHALWQRNCRKRGIETLSVSTSEDPTKSLIKFFTRRKGRKS
jgi:uncharacterized protein (DUF58 family)